MKTSKIIGFSAAAGAVMLLLLALVSHFFIVGKPVRVSASVSPSRSYIGQEIKYVLKVSFPSGADIILPEAKGKIGDLEVYGREILESSFLGKDRITAIYSLKSFNPGKYYIPSLKVSYKLAGQESREYILTEDMNLRIVPVVKIDPAKELLKKVSIVADSRVKEIAETGKRGDSREIEVPVRFPIKDVQGPRRVYTPKDISLIVLWSVLGLIVVVVVLVIAISVIWALFQGKEPPVYAGYVRELKELSRDKLLDKGETSAFCARLYAVMAGYIIKRFGFQGREMTTDEFLEAVRAVEGLDEDQKRFIEEKMRLYDLVKYSGYEPSKKDLEKALKEEINMIRELGKKEEPEEGSS